MPVVGYLSSGAELVFADVTAVFADSLGKAGFVSGKTVTIDYRWAEGQYDRLPAMAADLARHTDVIVASGGAVTALATLRFRSCSLSVMIQSNMVWPLVA
jgi:putative ABC transport system substrate-binding protein